ncbi:CPBP family intramembrane glutamic endopeptidase [Reichenbachiella sp.]
MKFHKPLLTTGVLLVLEILTFQVFLLLYDELLIKLEGTPEFFHYAINGDVISIIVAYLIFIFIYQNKFEFSKQLEGWSNVNPRSIALLVLAAFGGYMVANLLLKVDFSLIDTTNKIFSASKEPVFYPMVWLTIVFSSIFQEVLFRKYFLIGLKQRYSVLAAIFISGACYFLYQLFSYEEAIGTIPLSIITALVFIRTNKIQYSIIINFTFFSILELVDIFNISLHKIINFPFSGVFVALVGLFLVLFSLNKLEKSP